MSVWREVQEALLQRFADQWADRTPFDLLNDIPFDPPNDQWARVSVVSLPGQQSTLGPPGARKWDRNGIVYVQLREPPGRGVGGLSDLADDVVRPMFEGCRFSPHDIRIAVVDIGDEVMVEEGRWWGVTIAAPFQYEEQR